MPRTLTGNSPEREQRLQSLLLDRLVFKYERRIAKEITREMRIAAKAISDGISPDMLPSDHKNRITRLLSSLWMDSAENFANHILNDVKSKTGPTDKKKASVTSTEVIDRIMSEWIMAYGGDKITQITDTTRSDIKNIIEAGILAGDTELEIAEKIRAIAPTKSASRSQTIARTETHSSANAAAQASAKAVGLPMKRRWQPAGSRTRGSHSKAKGQIVGMDEKFRIGSDKLRYPGDPSGSAEETINCRCAIVFVIE